MPTTLEAASLPPEEAIAFFKEKVGVTSKHWTDLWNEAHSHGFMVAGAATRALVEDFRHEVQKAIEHGTTLADFRKQFDRIVEKHGWEHNGTPAWRAQIIYETNLSMAYAAGRYAQMTEPATLAVFPYWQYQHNAAQRPRPQHLAWNGLTLRADDGWWNTHYPPNGWRCHCSVRVVSERMLKRAGKDGPDRAPDIDLRPWKNPHTGEVVQVPHGIDPGFGYNPGRAWKEGIGRLPAAEAVPAPACAPVGRGELERWLAAPKGDLHLADMHEGMMRALGAASPAVKLSADTLEKQMLRHPEMTAADYHALVETLQAPQLVLRQSATHLLLLHRIAGGLYRAVVKTTRDRGENYLLSFHRMSGAAKLARLLAALPVVLGTPAALEPEDGEDADGE